MSRVGPAVLSLVALAGCGIGSTSETSAEARDSAGPPRSMAGPVDPDRCRLPTGPGQDVEGRAVDATLWALPFGPSPFRAGQEVKIVWRMTGAGPPRFTVTGPHGPDPDALRWGPEAHGASSWDRPGDEWGTGIRFAEPGCWRVTVRRDRGAGAVWFTVT